MTRKQYKRELHLILQEMSEKAGSTYQWRKVSVDARRHKDPNIYFGVDRDGVIVINAIKYSLFKVEDMNEITYTWNDTLNEPEDLVFITDYGKLMFHMLSENISFYVICEDFLFVQPYTVDVIAADRMLGLNKSKA